ncbi:hypothetical protein NQ318_002130 [Aromia moschata]|uniref:SEFIR domain-containing protein n=1 Tax=Aromia moschata TaxID=1265417 RepID=A0AAV8Y175_9CUCU|nr:hypothetical protein NQ318_002130 [Aromia moschata]
MSIRGNVHTANLGGNERLKNHLGDIMLLVQYDISSQLFLNVTFSGVKWNRAFLRLSDDNNKNQNVCKMYSVEKNTRLSPNSDLYDSCLWSTAKKLRAKTYLLEYKVENAQESMHKKILFDLPNINFFGDTVPITKRLIFSYIDFTSSYEIILNIQTLPKSYNVTRYKVEVFRERDKKTLLLDVRLLSSYRKSALKFEYLTYNEEGHYYFAISVISEKCPEDACMKTLTSKIYISRKGTPLVIGIVGASFIIPFVLFIFHMWNRRFKHQGGLPETVEKILILFKPSSEKHNDVVTTLAKTVKNSTGIEVMLDPVSLTRTKQKNAEKWCSDNLILASHIIYVAPPSVDDDNCELDYMTFNFLKEETKKSVPEKEIVVLLLPYSTREVPSILVGCTKFELMGDFPRFLNIFQPMSSDFSYENDINYMQLVAKIRLAQAETDYRKTSEAPRIVITDQSEEPNEIDGLL